MGGGGHLACEVAEVVLDLSEGFVLRQIDEPFGHLSEDLFGVGAQVLEEVLDAGFAVGGGLGRRRRRRGRHGVRPGRGSRVRVEFALDVPGYHSTIDFSPTFLKHTHRCRRMNNCLYKPDHERNNGEGIFA